MEHMIRQRLNAINRDFYRITAVEFDRTRQDAWQGWQLLLPYLSQVNSVLDIGCGNGRFGVFLAQYLKPALTYQGIDSSRALLARAADSLKTDAPGLTVQLDEIDLIENPQFPVTQSYDLVALFGVMHHIPGYADRLAFMQRLAAWVKPGGLLAFACWRFYEFERFRNRIIPWHETLQAKVETHDYLLDWRRGETAVRYCHYVDDAEHADLVSASGMTEIATYRADGESGTANRYSILKKV